jgi:hypothetical protein
MDSSLMPEPIKIGEKSIKKIQIFVPLTNQDNPNFFNDLCKRPFVGTYNEISMKKYLLPCAE